jgi:hypothetical protein
MRKKISGRARSGRFLSDAPWTEQSEVSRAFGDTKEHVKAIAHLIVSNEDFDEIFVFPPLKDWAKRYYADLEKRMNPRRAVDIYLSRDK